MIPKIIHYVWVGGPLPASKRRLVDDWSEKNPGYELVRWSEDNIDFSVPAIGRAYREKRWSKVADIVRLMAIYKSRSKIIVNFCRAVAASVELTPSAGMQVRFG